MSPAGPTPAQAAYLALSDALDAALRRARRDGWRMFRLGQAVGWRMGWEACEASLAEAQRRQHGVSHGPDFAVLEARRWGEGGRAHFGDPRPGDRAGTER